MYLAFWADEALEYDVNPSESVENLHEIIANNGYEGHGRLVFLGDSLRMVAPCRTTASRKIVIR